MNRAEAKAAGERFYTGKPCPHGHDGTRYTTGGTCVDCAKEDSARKVKCGYFKEHYSENAEQILVKQRAYYERSGGRNVAAAREWSRRNPEKRKAIIRQYRAKRRSQEEAGITGGMLAAWTLAQPKVCFYCDADCAGSFHVDHFVPLAKGGAHVLTNLRIACASCNLRKSDRDPMRFMNMRINSKMLEAA